MSKRAPLHVAAIRALTSDPTAMAVLSAPSRVLLSTVQEGLETAIGKSLGGVTEEVAAGLSESASNGVATAAADVISEVPVVGTVVGAVIKLLAAIFGGGDNGSAYCTRYLASFKAKPTGSMLGGGTTVPADVLASAHSIPSDSFWDAVRSVGFVDGVKRYPSALGAALMTITEGAPADAPAAKVRTVVTATDKAYKDDHPHKAVGIPEHRRRQFEALRKAIAASWGPGLAHGAKSDGGLALWPAYLDLLLAEQKAGHLPREWIVTMLARRGAAYYGAGKVSFATAIKDPALRGIFGDQTDYKPAGDPDRGCTSILADQIEALLSGWQSTVRPYYQGGQTQLASLQAQARAIATRSHPKASAPGRAEIAADED